MKQPEFWIRAKRPPPAPERNLHIAIADRLRVECRPNWWWSTIPSGEFRTKATGALLLRLGLMRGLPDILLVAPTGQHCWLEIKRPGGRLSEAQARFEIMCQDRGIPHAVVWSYDEAIAQLKQWGAL